MPPPPIETNTRKLKSRLAREGWTSVGGAKHDIYKHPTKPGQVVVVPRHAQQKPGTARSIARAAGWLP